MALEPIARGDFNPNNPLKILMDNINRLVDIRRKMKFRNPTTAVEGARLSQDLTNVRDMGFVYARDGSEISIYVPLGQAVDVYV